MSQAIFAECYSENEAEKVTNPSAASDALYLGLSMSSGKDAPQADLAALRRNITDLIAHNALAMVQRAIDSVNEEGQYQAIKYLFEMIGLYPPQKGDENEMEESLTQRLLQQLGLLDAAGQGGLSERTQRESVRPLQ